MANEKVFKIKIDGITRAYSDVIDLSKAIKTLENKTIKIDVETADIDQLASKIDKVEDTIKNLPDINIEADPDTVEEINTKLDELNEKIDDISQSPIICIIEADASPAEKTLTDFVKEIEESANAFEALSKSILSTAEIADTFDNTFKTTKDTLNLFGIENTALDGIMGKLSQTIGIVNSIQKISNTIVDAGYKAAMSKAKAIATLTDLENKEAKGLKASAAAQKLNTVAIGGGTFAVKAFSKALIATGIGAIVAALGFLIANFDDIKKQITEIVPGLGGLGDSFGKISAIFKGVGNVVLQYVLTPIKAVAGAIVKLLNKDFMGALKATKEAFVNGLDVMGNFQAGYDQKIADDQEKKRIADATAREKELNDQIKDNLKKQGSDWKYSEEAKKLYSEMFEKRLEMYSSDSEEYKNANREKEAYDREFGDREKKIAEEALAEKKRKQEQYKNAVQKVNEEIKAIDEESNKRNIANQKTAIENAIKAAKAIKVVDEESKKEKEKALNAIYEQQKEVIQAEAATAEEAAREKYDKIIAEAKRLNLDVTLLEEKKADEINSIRDNANSEILKKEEEKKEDTKALGKELEDFNKEQNRKAISDAKETMSEMKQILTDEYSDIQKKLKEATVKGAGGIIDPKKTKENLKSVTASLRKYSDDTCTAYTNILKKYDELLAKEQEGSDEYKKLTEEKEKVNKEHADKQDKINKDIEKATEETTEVQGKYYKELAQKVQKVADTIMTGVKAVFDIANTLLNEQLEEAKEKYAETTKQYDEAVTKQEESNSRLQNLQEKASNARGGRGLVLQQQIDAEMAKNQQLAAQEKKLAKDKEEQEKEIAKKERKKKKLELAQNIIQAVADTATGVAKAIGSAPPPFNFALAALVGAAGAVQVKTLTKQLSKLENGGLLKGKRHSEGGMRVEGTNIEVEGGEYVVNRESTNRNLGLIRYINSQRRELQPQDINAFFSKSQQGYEPPFRRMFEQGGQLPPVNNVVNVDNESLIQAIQAIRIEPKVSVTDINAAQDKAVEVSAWSGI